MRSLMSTLLRVHFELSVPPQYKLPDAEQLYGSFPQELLAPFPLLPGAVASHTAAQLQDTASKSLPVPMHLHRQTYSPKRHRY